MVMVIFDRTRKFPFLLFQFPDTNIVLTRDELSFVRTEFLN